MSLSLDKVLITSLGNRECLKVVNDTKFGSLWYHSEPLEVSYCPNQYLDTDFFATSYSKVALELLKYGFLKKLLHYNVS